ncbi:MAG: cytochrome c [Burkholderiales bacterium]|nr:cytochrome c [Burkholderiales bacterium]
MKAKWVAAGLAMAIGGGHALGAFAQAKPETLIRQRQAVMTLHGKYFFPLVALSQGKLTYDAGIAARNAGFLEALSQMPWDGFTPDTQAEKSRALPAIYANPSKFKAAQDNYRGAVGKLVGASKNEAAFKAATGDVLKACNACHDDFRGR